MTTYKSILIFSSLIASIYLLRSYNSIQSTQSNRSPSRVLGALKEKLCPSSTIDPPTSTDISNAEELRTKFFENMRSNENHLKTAIRTSEWTDYVKSLIAPTVVWLIFFALSFIGWMCYCICCCCDKKCPPCGCLRRDAEAHPYKGFELWGLILFIVIFGTGIVGISVAGIIFGTQIQGGVQNTVCTFASMYDDIIYGVTYNETNWIGISNTPEKVNSTIVDLAAYPDKFYNTFGDTKWIDTGINNLLMINRNIYTKYKVSYLSSPNPAYSTSVVTSNFLKNVTKIK